MVKCVAAARETRDLVFKNVNNIYLDVLELSWSVTYINEKNNPMIKELRTNSYLVISKPDAHTEKMKVKTPSIHSCQTLSATSLPSS